MVNASRLPVAALPAHPSLCRSFPRVPVPWVSVTLTLCALAKAFRTHV